MSTPLSQTQPGTPPATGGKQDLNNPMLLRPHQWHPTVAVTPRITPVLVLGCAGSTGAVLLRDAVTSGTDVLLPFPHTGRGCGRCCSTRSRGSGSAQEEQEGGCSTAAFTPMAAAPNSLVPGTTSENLGSLRHPESRLDPGRTLCHQALCARVLLPPQDPFLPPGSGATRYQRHHDCRGRPQDLAPSPPSPPVRLEQELSSRTGAGPCSLPRAGTAGKFGLIGSWPDSPDCRRRHSPKAMSIATSKSGGRQKEEGS